MIIITRQIEALKSKKTQQDLQLILKKWSWDGANPKNSEEFLNKFTPWVNEKIQLGKEVRELLKRKRSKQFRRYLIMNYREQQLRSELKKLQERNNLLTTVSIDVKNYLDLEQEIKDKDYKINSLNKEIKSHEGVLEGIVELLGKEIKNPQDLKNFLKGRTLKEWLDYFDNYLAKKEQDYSVQKDKLIAERSEVKNKLAQEKKDRKEVKKELEQLDKEFKDWKEVLGQFLDKYGVDKLIDLGKYLEELEETKQKGDNFLTKHKVKNYEEVSQNIENLNKDNQNKQTKISQQEKQRKDGEKIFSEIVEVIKPKIVIFKGKKIVKERLSNLKTVMGWDKTDTEGISEEE